MSLEKCPTCGTEFSEDTTDEQAEAEFAEAMEWYFNRDDSDEWQEYLSWKESKSGDG